MKQKIYTTSHAAELLKEIGNTERKFTAAEHSYITEKEFGQTVFTSKELLLRHFLQENWQKIGSLVILREIVEKNKFRNILSLGAGQCVLEYLLKISIPKVEVFASDFDSFCVEKAKQFFPEITAIQFDFDMDDVVSLKQKLGVEIDSAVFFGSAGVMDDLPFIDLFSNLRKIGVKHIVDFHGGFMDAKGVIKYFLKPLTANTAIRKLFGKPHMGKGKFHAYLRSRGELRRLYRDSGWDILREISAPSYKYVTILGLPLSLT